MKIKSLKSKALVCLYAKSIYDLLVRSVVMSHTYDCINAQCIIAMIQYTENKLVSENEVFQKWSSMP